MRGAGNRPGATGNSLFFIERYSYSSLKRFPVGRFLPGTTGNHREPLAPRPARAWWPGNGAYLSAERPKTPRECGPPDPPGGGW